MSSDSFRPISLLVLAHQPSQLLLGLLQGTLEIIQLDPGILEGTVPSLFSISDGRLQIGTLGNKEQRLSRPKIGSRSYQS